MSEPHTLGVAVIGAGIVGLATARAIQQRRPDLSLAVFEKEDEPARHQSGRNSGVIHAGLYYRPGSLKARLARSGAEALFAYCRERGIPTTQTGKVVVATRPERIPALDELERRAAANGVHSERLGPAGITEHEPHATGVEALWVRDTGAVDFRAVAGHLADEVVGAGASIHFGSPLTWSESGAATRRIGGDSWEAEARVVVNCAGLQVDRVARLLGGDPGVRIIPFRGEYYRLDGGGGDLVRGHVYPVPDPVLPHLGVHFTRAVDGTVEVGPNAVWAWGREAYRRLAGSPRDAGATLSFPGFWKLARRHWRAGVAEQWRSLNLSAFVREARQLIPAVERRHLGAYRAGVRAQAVDRHGVLVDDFLIEALPSVINVLNAPSPAATASLTIGNHIAARVVERLV